MKRSECTSRELLKAERLLNEAACGYAASDTEDLSDAKRILRIAARNYASVAELLKIEED